MTPHLPPRPGRDDDQLHGLLGQLRVDPVRPDDASFRAGLHRRLVAEAAPARRGFVAAVRAAFARRPALLWPATGVASGAAAFALLMLLRGPTVAPPLAIVPATPAAGALAEPVHRAPADKTAVIRINFATEVAVGNVTFDVSLPEGLSFWSGGEKGGRRSF